MKKLLLLTFSVAFAVLVAVALSAPSGNGKTFLQDIAPFAIGGGIMLAILVLFIWFADRQNARLASVANNAMQSNVQIAQISAKQQENVLKAIALGATLYQLPGNLNVAVLPSGAKVQVQDVEAEYWREIAPERTMLPKPQ